MASRKFPNDLTVASPCTADWDSMIGNDQVRFCEHCNLKVHNLSLMTRNQAELLVARSNGRLCVRYHHDSAGQMLALPVRHKLHRIGRRVSRIAAGAFTATLSVTSAVAENSTSSHLGNWDIPVATQPDTRAVLGASIVGTITGQNGAVIAGASISILTTDSRGAFYVSAGNDGKFRVDNLQAGVYELRIEAPGFTV